MSNLFWLSQSSALRVSPATGAFLKENWAIMGPKIALRLAVMLTIPIASILSWADIAAAQTAEQFYVGRSINVIVPYSPGGYYDIGARLLARHFGKHVVGKPKIIVQNQPQAGGIGLANRFASGADNDGTVLGVLQRAVPQYAFIGYQSAKFDPLKLNWIGSLSAYETELLCDGDQRQTPSHHGCRAQGSRGEDEAWLRTLRLGQSDLRARGQTGPGAQSRCRARL